MKLFQYKHLINFGIVFLVLFLFGTISEVWADVGNGVGRPGSGGGGSAGPSLVGFFMPFFLRHPVLAWIIASFGLWAMIKEFWPKASDSNNQDNNYECINGHNENISDLLESDPDFSEVYFLGKVNNIFVQLQKAWEIKDWRTIRPFETDELFNMHNCQLQEFIQRDRTNYINEIAILESRIVSFQNDGAYEVLNVLLKARFIDFIKDDKTGKVVSGDPLQYVTMTYLWKMIRSKGINTNLLKNLSATQCPNCGANVSINATGICEYCNSMITKGQFDWVLATIHVINQE